MIGALLRVAKLLFGATGPPGVVDQLSKRHRCPSWLARQPFPMTGEQSHFAWNDP
jgi:hypothetical protein